MKALSIRQPWAMLLLLGVKQFETRRWQTKYRGPLVIHAAASGRHLREDQLLRLELRLKLPPMSLAEKTYPLGAFIGVVQLEECLPVSPKLIAALTPLERALGCYEAGGWVWDVARAGRVPFAHPIPCEDRQGLWTLDVNLEARVRGLA